MTEEEEEEERKLGEDPQKSFLRQAIQLIASLQSISYCIKVFPVKWQLIREKLHHLNSVLTAARNCEFPNDSPIHGLVSAVILTVEEAQDLARRCIDLSYSGKLLMQSDLDVVAAKFERHVKNLSSIYTNGVISRAHALVVSRPGPTASREDMKFFIRDLFTRLKIGDPDMKKESLNNLTQLLSEDDKYVKIVAENPQRVRLLAEFLEFSDVGIQEKSAEVISVIAGFDSFKGLLVGSGVVASLIRVLEIGSEFGKEKAAKALQELTENTDNAWSVSAHGGVTILLKICSSINSQGELIGLACGVLKNLSGVEEIKRFMVEQGATSVFVRLLNSKDEVSQIRAVEFLQTIASGDETIREMVVREGGIPSLIRIFDTNALFSSKIKEVALKAIESLCFSSAYALNALISLGFLDKVLLFMRNGEVSIHDLAIKTASHLCGVSEEIDKAIGDAGFIPEFMKLLDAKSFEIREMAGNALLSLILIPRNRRRFVQDDSNIVRVLQLLNPEEDNAGNRKLLLSVLLSLINSNSGRKKIAASGYIRNLEKLAETEVAEAKRIVRKLSENRFRRLLSGIWHQGM